MKTPSIPFQCFGTFATRQVKPPKSHSLATEDFPSLAAPSKSTPSSAGASSAAWVPVKGGKSASAASALTPALSTTSKATPASSSSKAAPASSSSSKATPSAAAAGAGKNSRKKKLLAEVSADPDDPLNAASVAERKVKCHGTRPFFFVPAARGSPSGGS